MENSETIKTHASKLSGFLGLQRSTIGVLAMVVLVGAVFFISWSAISLPATMSLAFKVLPQNKRTVGVSMHSLVRRIPMALGPMVGGLFIGIWGERGGVRIAFGAALIMAGVALVMQQRMIEADKSSETDSVDAFGMSPEMNPIKLLKMMNPSMKRLLVTDILVKFNAGVSEDDIADNSKIREK